MHFFIFLFNFQPTAIAWFSFSDFDQWFLFDFSHFARFYQMAVVSVCFSVSSDIWIINRIRHWRSNDRDEPANFCLFIALTTSFSSSSAWCRANSIKTEIEHWEKENILDLIMKSKPALKIFATWFILFSWWNIRMIAEFVLESNRKPMIKPEEKKLWKRRTSRWAQTWQQPHRSRVKPATQSLSVALKKKSHRRWIRWKSQRDYHWTFIRFTFSTRFALSTDKSDENSQGQKCKARSTNHRVVSIWIICAKDEFPVFSLFFLLFGRVSRQNILYKRENDEKNLLFLDSQWEIG